MTGVGTETSGNFGALLRQYRVAAGLSLEELADRAGLSARASRPWSGEPAHGLFKSRLSVWPPPWRCARRSTLNSRAQAARQLLAAA